MNISPPDSHLEAASCSTERLHSVKNSLPQSAKTVQAEQSTYGQILKSSALVGGSSVLAIILGIIRTKAVAVILGPAGYGLFGLYGSIATLTQTFSGMGINSSGVRQIAAAAGSDDKARISKTVVVLRRSSIVLGVLGAIMLLCFSRQISKLTFGSSKHAMAVSALSVVVLFSQISAGQGALIQGMRRIADIARVAVIGATAGTLVSLPLVYLFRENGIVPALMTVAIVSTGTSWWYSRTICTAPVSVNIAEVLQETWALLKLGFAFMASGLMTLGVAYVVRITLLQKVSFAAMGLYQSAWTLGGLYVGFILQAMGADFYPRLTAVANDDETCNRLVNEQAQVGMLLGGPGVIATLAYAPVVIALLYSSKFGSAIWILRWICLGTLLQVITWPMGFIIIAKAKQSIFLVCELTWTIVSLLLAWISIKYFGLNGAGIAFFGSYIFHGLLIYAVVRRVSGFRWSSGNVYTGLLFFFLVAGVFCSFYLLPLVIAELIGTSALLFSGIYSMRVLAKLTSRNHLPSPLRRAFKFFGISPA